MIDEFKKLLKQHLNHQISAVDLEHGLNQILINQPNLNSDIQSILLELMGRRLITKSVFDRLYNLCQRQQSELTNTAQPETLRSNTGPKENETLIGFQDAIKRYQNRQCDYNYLEKCLLNDVAKNEQFRDKYEQVLNHLQESQILNVATAERLQSALKPDVSHEQVKDTVAFENTHQGPIQAPVVGEQNESKEFEQTQFSETQEASTPEPSWTENYSDQDGDAATAIVSQLVAQYNKQRLSQYDFFVSVQSNAEKDAGTLQSTLDDTLDEFRAGNLIASDYLNLLSFMEQHLKLDLSGYKECVQQPDSSNNEELNELIKPGFSTAPNKRSDEITGDLKDIASPSHIKFDSSDTTQPETPPELKADAGVVPDTSVNKLSAEEEPEFDEDKTVVKKPQGISSLSNVETTNHDELLDTNDSEDKTKVRAFSNANNPDYTQNSVSDDDDKTVVKVPGDITSQTSRTSQTSNTANTSATWSRPFDVFQEGEPLKLGDVLKERYELIDFIGRGGMGDVFKAKDLLDSEIGDVNSEVAIKILNKEFRGHPDSLKSLQREAKKTQGLAHPHIVNVFNLERDDYNVFMTMEMMTGDPLNIAIKKNINGFERSLAKKYITELCNALQYAHKRNVIHSDLKPGNIFISNGEIKVFDFGIARAANVGGASNIEAEESNDSSFDVDSFFNEKDRSEADSGGRKEDDFDAGTLGALTPTYASPEMLQEELNDADARDDIYALGCIVYELLIGKHPFMDGRKKVPADKAWEKGMKPPKVPGLKKWQQKALEKTLAFKREDRTASVAEFLDQFLIEKKAISGKHILLWGGATLSSIALAVIGYMYVDQKDKREMLSNLKEKDHASILEFNGQYLDEDGDDVKQRQEKLERRNKVYRETEVSIAYKDYITKRIPILEDNEQFAEAKSLLDQTIQIYPEIWVDELKRNNEKAYFDRIAELDKQLVALLETEHDVLDYQRFKTFWDSLKRIAPDSDRLKNITPALRLNDSINRLIAESRLSEAKEMADFALAFYEDDKTVFGDFVVDASRQIDVIDKIINDQTIDQQLHALANELEGLIQSTDLDEYRAKLSIIKEFADLAQSIDEFEDRAPSEELVTEIQENLFNLVESQLEPLLTERQWSQATDLVRDLSSALSANAIVSLEQKIQTSESQYTELIDDLTRSVQLSVRNSQFNEAEGFIEQLKLSDASDAQIDNANTILARGWLVESRKLKNTQQWEDAKKAVLKGLEFAGAESQRLEFNTELAAIDNLKVQFENKAEAELLAELQNQKQENINRLVTKINLLLDDGGVSVSKISQLQNLIAELEGVDPTNDAIKESQDELVKQYVQKIEGEAVKDLESAIEMTESALSILPQEASLQNKMSQLNETKQQVIAAQQQQRLKAVEESINRMLDNLVQSGDHSIVLDEITKYERLQTESVPVQALKELAVPVFIELSRNLSIGNQFDEARKVLASAKKLNVQSALIDVTLRDIDAAKNEYEERQRLVRENARIDSLKQSFVAQIQSLDIDTAEKTRVEVTKILSASDTFLLNTVPEEFAKAYNRLGNSAMNSADFDLAKSWFNRTISVDSGNREARNQLEVINGIGEIERIKDRDRIRAQQLLEGLLQKFPDNTYVNSVSIPEEVVAPLPKSVPVNETPRAIEPAVDKVPQPVVAEPEPVKPKTSGVKCDLSLAGKGTSKPSCYDMLPGEVKGPRLLVLPPYNGKNLSISRYEIRVEEFNHYCQQTTECSPSAADRNKPITGISVSEAEGFVKYLSDKTGQNYRIPTLSEWQFAASANGAAEPRSKNCKAYSSGILQLGLRMENINFDRRRTQNVWGVSNYLGNASELVKDDNNTGVYYAVGGSFEDSYNACTLDRQESVGSSLGAETGLRIIKELSE